MLNVQEVRLRFIFVRALYPVPLFSKALEMHRLFQNGHGCPWFHATAMFLRCKNSRPEVYTDVHFWTVYFKRLTESMFYDMLLLKMLNVSERPRTGVVPSNSDILALPKFAFKN